MRIAKTLTLSAQVRRALAEAGACGVTRYRIAELVGLTQSAMTRFVTGGGGVEMATLDKIGAILGMTLRMNKAKVRALAKQAPKPGRPAEKRTREARHGTS